MPVVKPDGLSESAVAANTKMLSRSIRKLVRPMWKYYREWEKQFTLVTQLTNPECYMITQGLLDVLHKPKDDGSGEIEEVEGDKNLVQHAKVFDYHNCLLYALVHSNVSEQIMRALGSAVKTGDGIGLWNMIKLRATKTGLMNFSRMKTQFYSAKQRPPEPMVAWVTRLNNLREKVESSGNCVISDGDMCLRLLDVSEKYRLVRSVGAMILEDHGSITWDAFSQKMINHCQMMTYEQFNICMEKALIIILIKFLMIQLKTIPP